MHEATFRIAGDGAYAAATAGTDASVELWCNDHCDLLYVTAGATDEILAHVREKVGVQDLLRRPDELVVITAECLKRHEDDLIDDGFSVTVERKREIETVTHDAPLLTLDGVLPDLSPRQREIFSTAYDDGYYEIPRETTTEEIAEGVGIERRTAEEHLRRAENKLVVALIEYIRA